MTILKKEIIFVNLINLTKRWDDNLIIWIGNW